MDGEHPVHIAHRLGADGIDAVGRLHAVGVGGGRADLQHSAPQRTGEGPVHLSGVARRLGVGHRPQRHQPVLAHQVEELRPVAPVTAGALQDGAHLLVVQVVVGHRDRPDEDVVRLLQLVVEGHEVLGEGEVIEVELLDEPGPQHVEAGELPAPPGVLLIGDGPGVEPLGDRLVEPVDHRPVKAHRVRTGARHRILHDPGHRVRVEGDGPVGREGRFEGAVTHVWSPVSRSVRCLDVLAPLCQPGPTRSSSKGTTPWNPEWVQPRSLLPERVESALGDGPSTLVP